MICERCGERPVASISTKIENEKKQAVYLCDVCANRQAEPRVPALERPCDRCGQREGTVKMVRLRENARTVSFICDVCAKRR